jgi:2-isopropylmalate synthase
MALKTRADHYGVRTGILTERLYETSRLLTELTGLSVQTNKAIVGANAFAHASGIHQDGLLKHETTYEIMTPQSVGAPERRLVLSKHSGRHALRHELEKAGINPSPEFFEEIFQRFKILADGRKEISAVNLGTLIGEKPSKKCCGDMPWHRGNR